MLPDMHRQAAEELEAAVAAIQADAQFARLVIEGRWAAAFHWIAYRTQTQHGRHQDSHARLGTFLRSLGEAASAEVWERLDQVRQGGLYGTKTSTPEVQLSAKLLGDIRTWALS
ncbi:MAG TPA: hypothetical protein VLJ14_16615 [Ktedonobacterales bacterium]|jgi:hypothetical protein|nr:hypothetical protein [Ktedonobacterales bacterium]